jgi:hypothetical protein
MGTVDRDCAGAQPRGGTSAAGAARPWHALTASLSVVVCCFVWLCIRQCHALIVRTRAELSENLRARAVAGVERAHARVAEAANHAGYSFLAQLNPMLGFATTLLVIPLNAPPRMPVAVISEPGDNLLSLFNDTLDISRFETGRLAVEQRAFSPENLVDLTVGMAGAWADPQAIGLWMGDFNGAGTADILWQNNNGHAAAWLMNGHSLIFASDAGSDPGAASQIQAAGDFSSHDTAETLWQDADGMPAAWLMDGFNLVSDNDAGFNPLTDWQETAQYYDLL